MNRIGMRCMAALLTCLSLAAFAVGCQPAPKGNGATDDPATSGAAAESSPEASGKGEKMELNVLNWGDYIDEEVLADFESEYPNITVNYEVMASNEEMLVLLSTQGAIYDVCFPSDYAIQKLIQLDLLDKIDMSKVPNVSNIDPRFMDLPFDPGNAYSIPYHWGTVGILYNKTMVSETVDNWSVLWDERYKKQIFMYDSKRDTIGVALKRLGYSLNTTVQQELDEAKQSLIEQKPLVTAYGIDDLRDKMISGSGALAVVYSGDAIAAMAENEDLDYAVPMEGSNIWYDNMVMLKNGKNKEAAYLFMDFLCRADIAQRNTEYIGYSTPNAKALEGVAPELRDNPVYNPPQDVIDRCEPFVDLGDFIKAYDDAWTQIRTQ